MTFDELITAGRASKELVMPATWSQGRATFGGLVTALLFDRMARMVSDSRPMRSMHVSFIGPVEADVPAVFDVSVLREGGSVSQVEGRITQNGEPRLVSMAAFAGGRESVVQVDGVLAPAAKPVEECQGLPFIEGVTPGFIGHIEMRWVYGSLPFSGGSGREMGGWMRFREVPEIITDAHIVALIDAWPAPVLQHFKSRVPASSLSWAFDIIHPRPALNADDWLLYKATIDQTGDGYCHFDARVWTPRGELVAVSRQTATVFG
ncbi:acyl-CoA thioesterase [Streptosporangium jomthongense]|uniref:Acyl-CoA thioesterase n=1 Tax=Marinobacter aromaticivorans TaxID=1494078 RepID=A0ABW2IVL7_9GAMM|nr:thioesterase family protein [Marinobacter aromaticivorans]GGE67365.1 acyl-CoA thioesterase [Streptosporangium jomthongense]